MDGWLDGEMIHTVKLQSPKPHHMDDIQFNIFSL